MSFLLSCRRSRAGRVPSPATLARPDRCRAVTLVESMVSLFVMSLVMLGLLGNFIHSRRVSESAVLHAAATSLVYGMIEQIKELDYTSLLPNYETDPAALPVTLTPPYIRLRVNQEKVVWLQVVHTTPTDEDPDTATLPPQGPTTTPAPTAEVDGAIDNFIGSLPLSTVTGSTSQEINLNIWVWIDDIGNEGTWAAEEDEEEDDGPQPDVADVKKITIIYTYSYRDGNVTRTVRDREVIIRSRFDQ